MTSTEERCYYRRGAEVSGEGIRQVRGRDIGERRARLHDTNHQVIFVYAHSDDVIATHDGDVTSKVVYQLHQPAKADMSSLVYSLLPRNAM